MNSTCCEFIKNKFGNQNLERIVSNLFSISYIYRLFNTIVNGFEPAPSFYLKLNIWGRL